MAKREPTEKQIAARFQSGNTAWKKRTGPPSEVYQKLAEYSAEAVEIVYKIAKSGKSEKAKLEACRMLWDRCWGRAPQELKVSQNTAPDPAKLVQLLLSQARDGAIEIVNEGGTVRLLVNNNAIDVTPGQQQESNQEHGL